MTTTQRLVIGNGWAALSSVAFAVGRGESVTWLSGSGTRLIAPLPTVEAGAAVAALLKLAGQLGCELTEPPRTANFLREFRNKSFRESPWTKAPTPEARKEVRDEMLWKAEQRFVPVFESWISADLSQWEEMFRTVLLGHPQVTFLDSQVPVREVSVDADGRPQVIMDSGEVISAQQLIYADTGSPAIFKKIRGREPVSVLQTIFTHAPAWGQAPAHQGYYGAIHREAGEENQRSVWGYFLDEGRRSLWTLVLAPSEVEDNHEIAKKLRRMKQALDKMFSASGLLPEGAKDFESTIQGEQVRFEENVLFSKTDAPVEPVRATHCDAVWVTDGYGPSSAIEQAAWIIERTEIPLEQTEVASGPQA